MNVRFLGSVYRATMKRIACFALLFWGSAGCSWKSNHPVPLRIEEINDRQVIGYLGLPLLQPVTLSATIVGGESKATGYMYLLSVSAINGVPCKDKRQFTFRVLPPNEADDAFGLVSDHSGFKGLQKRADGHRFTDEYIERLRLRYPGAKLRIRAYETGAFFDGGRSEFGIGSRHHLHTELIVLATSEDDE